MRALKGRRQAHRATAISLVTGGAVLRKQSHTIGSLRQRRAQAKQAGQQPCQCSAHQATPTMMEVVQWNMELVLAMHQLMSLCTPRR